MRNRKEYMKQYRAENLEKIRERKKQYRAQNSDVINEKQKRYSRTMTGRFTKLRNCAKNRQLMFDITLQEYELLILGRPCYYCEGDLPEAGGGLDRVDSNLGYLVSNVVPCCFRCNTILGDLSKPKVFEHIRKMLSIYEKTCNIGS